MFTMNKTRGRAHVNRRPRLAVFAGIVAALLALAACGGGASDGPSTGGSEPDKVDVSADALQKTVNTVLQTTAVEAGSLPETLTDALKRATPVPDQATMDKALDCWKRTTCTLGDGKITLALTDGFGQNTWRKFTKMNVILQALTHPEIGKFIYTDAGFDLTKYQSDIRNVVSQGAKIVVTTNDFGPAAYPAFTAAQRSGATVVTYISPDAAPTSTITSSVQTDLCKTGKSMAETTEKTIGASGPVAYFAGPAGNPLDAAWQKCATEAGMEAAFKADTGWTPAGAQKAASALIASGKSVKAILYSYSNPIPSIVKAFEQADLPIPAITTFTQDNGTTCLQKELKFPLFQTSAQNWAARVAVDVAMEKQSGEDVPKQVVYPTVFVPADPKGCVAGAPDDFPGTSAFVPDALAERMLGR
jgi:ribose transport system substrate-binding protein